METLPQFNRRKACDLCFTKKIKCDMLKPICSNCQLYKAECKTTSVRRKAAPSRPKPVIDAPAKPPVAAPAASAAAVSTGDETQSDRVGGLESRLARIEDQLQQVLAVAMTAINNSPALTPAPPARRAVTPGIPVAAPVIPAAGIAQQTTPTTMPSSSGTTSAAPADYGDLSEMESILQVNVVGIPPEKSRTAEVDYQIENPSVPSLPPLDEIIGIIDDYFTHVNAIIPLFAKHTFMKMLNNWYSSNPKRSKAAWAAVNIVLAMGSRLTPLPMQIVDFTAPDKQLSKYLRNAQSALSELVTRTEDLLGLQVLLGLVLLFQSTHDPQPSTVLIGTAVRLAHRLRLQTQDSDHNYTPDQVAQRRRLFWITYVYDKDISLRYQMPSIQLDGDIDLDLPSANPADGSGDIFTEDGKVRFNYFRARVQLAHLQGKIYDMLYSARSFKVSPEERRSRMGRLEVQLEDWRQCVPPEMQMDSVFDNLGRVPRLYMAQLHAMYVSCLVFINGIWSHDANWIRRISSYSRIAIGSTEVSRNKCCTVQQPPLPLGWSRCVMASRQLLTLMHRMPQSDSSLWLNGCAYFSGLVVVLANTFENPEHPDVEGDKEIADYALSVFNSIKDGALVENLDTLFVIVAELDRRAKTAVELAKRRKLARTGDTLDIPGEILAAEDQSPSLEANSTAPNVDGEIDMSGMDMTYFGNIPWPEGDAQRSFFTGDLAAPSIFHREAETYSMDLSGHEAGPFGDWDARIESQSTPFGGGES